MSHEKEKKRKKRKALKEIQTDVLEGKIWPSLEKAGLPRHFWPQKVGDVCRGEWGLVGVEEVRKNIMTPMWHVTYTVQNPFTEEQCPYEVKYSGGAVAVVIVNKKHILLTNKHRFPIGVWQREFPQSFTEDPEPSEQQLQELQDKKLQWLIEAAESYSWSHLGFVHEESGTMNTRSQIYCVEVEVTEEAYEEAILKWNNGEKQTRRSPLQFQLVEPEEIEERIDEGKISSLLLIGAWYKALRCGKIPFAT
ncbi:hypothetical protein KKC60_03020 [Patescibacteria group bacterium]|nr:hypothetical protein [Patescibacteria group bacterium]